MLNEDSVLNESRKNLMSKESASHLSVYQNLPTGRDGRNRDLSGLQSNLTSRPSSLSFRHNALDPLEEEEMVNKI